MQGDNNIFYRASIIFSILTIVSVFLVNMDVTFICLGFSQLFTGLNQVKLSQDNDAIETQKGNKIVGIFTIIVGLFIIIFSINKLMF